MAKKKGPEELETKILDVDASMQGTITFRDPVNLRINGSFEGKLDTRGTLSIGENAVIHADIHGDNIVIAGVVHGNIVAADSLSVVSPGRVQGDIQTSRLSVGQGAIINGKITMGDSASKNPNDILTLKEVAQYLEVETTILEEWAHKKKIPAYWDNNVLKFKKAEVDKWIQEERVKV